MPSFIFDVPRIKEAAVMDFLDLIKTDYKYMNSIDNLIIDSTRIGERSVFSIHYENNRRNENA